MGLEPTPCCQDGILNPARLPIPPLRLECFDKIIYQASPVKCKKSFIRRIGLFPVILLFRTAACSNFHYYRLLHTACEISSRRRICCQSALSELIAQAQACPDFVLVVYRIIHRYLIINARRQCQIITKVKACRYTQGCMRPVVVDICPDSRCRRRPDCKAKLPTNTVMFPCCSLSV